MYWDELGVLGSRGAAERSVGMLGALVWAGLWGTGSTGRCWGTLGWTGMELESRGYWENWDKLGEIGVGLEFWGGLGILGYNGGC